MPTLGEELGLARARIGISLQKMASASGVSVSAIHNAELEIKMPRKSTVIKLANVLTEKTESEWLALHEQTINRRENMTKTEPKENNLFSRDFAEPVYILGDKTVKRRCVYCQKGKVKAIVNKRKIEADCAMCEGTGGVDGITKTIHEVYIKSICDKLVVAGNIRETIYELQSRTVHNNAMLTRTNSKDDLQVFDTRKQADQILKAYLDGDGK